MNRMWFLVGRLILWGGAALNQCTYPQMAPKFATVPKSRGADGPYDNYGVALATHPGKSSGAATRALSSWSIGAQPGYC